MNNASLPIEVLEIIVKDVILECEDGDPRISKSHKFLPRWYLTHLLRVCKLWYMVAERFLYQNISVGSRFRRSDLGIRARQAAEIAKELLRVLTTKARLAALVEELRMGMDQDWLEWAQTNTQILQCCPNVKHVAIHGTHASELATLTDVLKAKSPISFCFTTRFLPTSRRDLPVHTLDLFRLIQSWPKLRSVMVEGFRILPARIELCELKPSAQSYHYPELLEIAVAGKFSSGDIPFVRNLCTIPGRATTLSLSLIVELDSDDVPSLSPFCRCIYTWPKSLEYLKLKVMNQWCSPCAPLWEALSTLEGLRELYIDGLFLHFDALANLPRLERLEFGPQVETDSDETRSFAICLEYPKKFVALKHIGTRRYFWNGSYEQLKDVCLSRGINLD